MGKLLITTAAIAFGFSAAGSAQSVQAPASQQQAAKPARDPNEIVCERQQEIGSRIASQRVCKTRAEWAEDRRAQRQDVDKAQMQRDLSH